MTHTVLILSAIVVFVQLTGAILGGLILYARWQGW